FGNEDLGKSGGKRLRDKGEPTMFSATVRNSRLWWTGAVALSLLAIAGWQAHAQNRAPAKNPPPTTTQGANAPRSDEKVSQSTMTTHAYHPQVKDIDCKIEAQCK